MALNLFELEWMRWQGLSITAESYGGEDVVGEAIRAVREDIFLATKVSPRHFKYSEVITAVNQSLKRLNTDYIDLYQLYWATSNFDLSSERVKMLDVGVAFYQ